MFFSRVCVGFNRKVNMNWLFAIIKNYCKVNVKKKDVITVMVIMVITGLNAKTYHCTSKIVK